MQGDHVSASVCQNISSGYHWTDFNETLKLIIGSTSIADERLTLYKMSATANWPDQTE